jgi:hypothetical protein
VFPKQDVVGWYATGAEVQAHDMAVHKKVGARCTAAAMDAFPAARRRLTRRRRCLTRPDRRVALPRLRPRHLAACCRALL